MTPARDEFQGVHLRFFMHASARHHGQPLHEWLLAQARREGIGGASVLRAVAGYGRHGVLHEERFLELAADLPLRVEFLLRAEEAERVLELVRREGVELVWARSSVTIGLGGGANPADTTSEAADAG